MSNDYVFIQLVQIVSVSMYHLRTFTVTSLSHGIRNY